MQEMMKDPSFKNLMKNPELITQGIDMVKGNPAMLEMISKQMGPNVDKATLEKGLNFIGKLAHGFVATKNFFTNKTVQLAMVLLVLSFFYWLFG